MKMTKSILKKNKKLKMQKFVNTVQPLKSVLVTLVIVCAMFYVGSFCLTLISNNKKRNYLEILAFSKQNLASSSKAAEENLKM